ncbi:MAG TPA: 6-bladed beta-propeller [Edaphocola sp.]|nr:6-bladed beta-propeller [Edaphocola sp.]
MNKMKIVNISLLAIVIVLTACHDRSDVQVDPIMKIHNTDLHKEYKLSEIIDSIQLIPLETSSNCLIGNCKKVLVSSQYIYIYDDVSKGLFVFDLKGKLKKRIKNLGKGPNEYLEIEDFCLSNNGDIALLDGGLKKVIFVNHLDFSLTDQQIPFFADAIEFLDDKHLVFNGSAFEDRIIIWNYKNKSRVSSFIKYNKKSNSTRTLKPLIKYGDNVYYAHEFQTNLEQISVDNIKSCKYIDFGKYNFQGDFMKVRFLGITDLYINPPNTATIYNYTETESIIYFQFQIEEHSDSPYFVFFSKTTKNKIILNNHNYEDDVVNYPYPPVIETSTPNGGLVAILHPSFLLENSDKLKNKSGKLINDNKFDSVNWVIKDLKITDNPIIAICYFKKM